MNKKEWAIFIGSLIPLYFVGGWMLVSTPLLIFFWLWQKSKTWQWGIGILLLVYLAMIEVFVLQSAIFACLALLIWPFYFIYSLVRLGRQALSRLVFLLWPLLTIGLGAYVHGQLQDCTQTADDQLAIYYKKEQQYPKNLSQALTKDSLAKTHPQCHFDPQTQMISYWGWQVQYSTMGHERYFLLGKSMADRVLRMMDE